MEYQYLPLSKGFVEDFTESQYIDFFSNNKNNTDNLLGGVIGDIQLYHKKKHFLIFYKLIFTQVLVYLVF